MIFQIPLYSFLFAYFAFLAIFLIFIAINFYHIFSSGTLTMINFFVTIFVLGVAIFGLFGTHQLLVDTDWQQPITIFNSAWITGVIPESSL